MPLPSAGRSATQRRRRTLRATFRLDSLRANGELARSCRCADELAAGADGTAAAHASSTGAMTGAMPSTARAAGSPTRAFTRAHPLGRHAAERRGTPPMQFVTKVTQRLRTMDKR